MKDFYKHYLSFNWDPIPVAYRGKQPAGGRRWQERETSPSDFDGETNIGIRLGKTSDWLVDIDLDCPEALTLADLFLPPTATFGRASTPMAHRLYRTEGAKTKKFQDPTPTAQKRVLLEIRSTGGQTVFPPSIHTSGERIEWANELPVTELSAEELSTICKQLAGACLLKRHWPASGRHEAQLALAGALLQLGLGTEEALALLIAIAGDEPKRRSTIEGTAAKIAAGEVVTSWGSLANALDRKVLARAKQWLGAAIDANAIPGIAVDTEAANARRLLAAHGEDLRYIVEWKKWITWDGIRWTNDQIAARKRALDAIEGIYAEADASPDREYAKHLRKWARTSSNHYMVEGTLESAVLVDSRATSLVDLDNHPDFLAFPNGVLDLSTGDLMAPDKETLLTKLCPTPYDRTAECPRFEAAVLASMGDNEELAVFLQLAVGYSLLARPSTHEVMFFCHGLGMNGKSMILGTLQRVLGPDYAGTTQSSMVLRDPKSNVEHPTVKTTLYGKRFIWMDEPDAGKELVEGVVKAISGKDPIQARRMREDFWTFQPTHVTWLACNQLPRIRGTDTGIWRRVILIPWEVRFAPDPGIDDALSQEAQGILRWAIDGAMAVRQHPALFVVPEKCQAAKGNYRKHEDRLAEFLEAETAPGGSCLFRDAYLAYHSWCAEERENPVSRKAFSTMLKERGLGATEAQTKGKEHVINGVHLTGSSAGVRNAVRAQVNPE